MSERKEIVRFVLEHPEHVKILKELLQEIKMQTPYQEGAGESR